MPTAGVWFPTVACTWLTVKQYDPTIEDSFRKVVDVYGEKWTFNIVDTGGRPEYADVRDKWIRRGDCFVLVYSISSRRSFSWIIELCLQIRLVRGLCRSSSWNPNSPLGVPVVPILLLGNKSDRDKEREVPKQDGHATARLLGCEFVEVSAEDGTDLDLAFNKVLQILCQRLKAQARQLEEQTRTENEIQQVRRHRAGGFWGFIRWCAALCA